MVTFIWRVHWLLYFFMLFSVSLAEESKEGQQSISRGKNNNDSKKSKARFVRYLNEENYQKFIDSSNVEIVYFQRKDSRRMQTFLREYENSAERLLAFGIYLGLVDCQHHSVSHYCHDERSLQYAFGFRNGLEKIALPLDTLFDVDSIVASALHLSLIHNVPIIQTLSERKALEMKCKGRYNIVFSYQKALGTYEHRVFMELAYTFLDKYVFAMTISEVAVQDLRHFSEDIRKFDDPDRYSNIEPTLWIIYCQWITDHQQDCSQSYYYGRFHYLDVFHFVQSLDAPHYVEFPNQKSGEELPYNPFEIHLLYVINNDEDETQFQDLISTYEPLSQMFAGSVGFVFIHASNSSDEGLKKLGLPNGDELKVTPSTFAWKSKGQDSLIWKKDCEDLQQFILDHLKTSQTVDQSQLEYQLGESAVDNRKCDENDDDDLYEELNELQQDDTVAEYVRLSASDSSQLLQMNETDYSTHIANNSVALVLFYVEWDPNCQVAIQTLIEIQEHLKNSDKKSKNLPFIGKIDCFDWPKICQTNAITVYPSIKIFVNKGNATRDYFYDGLIHKQSILNSLKLYDFKNPFLLNSLEEALKFSEGNLPFDSTNSIGPNFVVLIGYSSEEITGRKLADDLVTWLMGKSLIGYAVDEVAQNIARHFKVDLPFLVLYRPNDLFQPFSIFDRTLKINQAEDNFQSAKSFIQDHQLDTFAQLSPANLPAYRKHQETDLVIYFSDLQEIAQDPQWTTFGKIAASGNYPRLYFTWMLISDPLAKSLRSFYKIQSSAKSAVRIQFQKGTYCAIQGGEISQVDSIERWLEGTLQTDAMHTEKLIIGDWKPLNPGFDFLRLIDEDTGTGEMDHLSKTAPVNRIGEKYMFDKNDRVADKNDINVSNQIKVTYKSKMEKGNNIRVMRSEL